jgi:WD40 repeat protein
MLLRLLVLLLLLPPHTHTQSFLLTGSMDGTIKVWNPGSSPAEIINPTPEFKCVLRVRVCVCVCVCVRA